MHGLSNIYAEKGGWDDVAKVRGLMAERGLKKDLARQHTQNPRATQCSGKGKDASYTVNNITLVD